MESHGENFFDMVGENSGVVAVLAGIFAGLAVAILAVNFALNANPIVKVITLIAALAAGLVILINYLVNLYGGWDKLFRDISGWLITFVAGFKNAINAIGGFFSTMFNGITSIAKNALNAVITVIEGYINRVIGGVNTLVDMINNVLTAGKVIGIDVKLGKIPPLNIPRLAEGGIVLPRPGGVLANIAEGGEAEAVIPLSKMGRFGQGQTTYNITVSGGLATGSDIGRSVVNAIRDFERQSGTAWRT
jgi:hypothetical protein